MHSQLYARLLAALATAAALLGALVPLALSGCGPSAAADRATASDTSRIVVTVPPLRSLVAGAAREDATVTVLIPAGQSVHAWEPAPADIAALARADVVVSVGLGLEGTVESVIGRSSAVPLSVAEILGIDHDHADHHHQEEGDDHHHDEATDPHLWLDPVLARRFVEALPLALPGLFPQDRTAAVLAEIDRVDAEYRERLAPHRGRAIVTHHAAFTRAAARYGLEVAAVVRTIETAEPTPAELTAAINAIRARQAAAVFVEPQFNPRAAQRVAELAGVTVGTLDPLGDGDWAAMMRSNLDELVRVFEASAP